MHRPSAEDFFEALIQTLDDLPPEFVRRFMEVLKKEDEEKSRAILQLFEELAVGVPNLDSAELNS